MGQGGTTKAAIDGIGVMLRLFQSYPTGLTRTEVVQLSGLSRTSVNQRLEPLLAARLLVPLAEEARTGGRPADRFVINNNLGVVLIADVGGSGLRAALCDLGGHVRADRFLVSDVADGPVAVLNRIIDLFTGLLAEDGRSISDVRGIAIDVPGPVDHVAGRVVSPPIMTGWHNFDIPGFFRSHFDAPVLVEKDTNAMALGEHHVTHPKTPNLVFVKLGTGIGSGIIVEGKIYRGADGAAGEIGHIQIADDLHNAPTCRCGNLGCVEAYAGGWALQRDLNASGLHVTSVSDVVRLTREGHPEAVRLFKRAAGIIGSAVSDIVNLFNPETVVLGGQMAAVDDLLFASVRQFVYRRSLPLATRQLQIVPSSLGEKAGIHGLVRLIASHLFTSGEIATLLKSPR